MTVKPALTGALALICLSSSMLAKDKEIQATWAELEREAKGHKISTVLTDSTLVEGRAVSVTPDALVVNVRQTKQPTRFTGTSNIPRDLVTTVRVSRPGWKWRVIGPVTGFFVIGISGGLIGNKINPRGFIISDGAATGSTYGALAGIGIGYILGHFADQHHRTITITK